MTQRIPAGNTILQDKSKIRDYNRLAIVSVGLIFAFSLLFSTPVFADIKTTLDSTGNVGWYTSIAIGNDGFPVISYTDVSNFDLKVVHCTNASCTTKDIPVTLDSAGDVGSGTSIAIGENNFPIISYFDNTNTDLKVITQFETCSPTGPGDWFVGADCSLDSSDIAPEDVIVQNNSRLTILPGVTLDIDFVNHSLTVKSGSSVLIKFGGTVT